MEALMQPTFDQLQAGLEHIRQSPKNEGALEMIVRRPRTGEREVLGEGHIDLASGLVGDNWLERIQAKRQAGPLDTGAQLTIMNSRAALLVARSKERWHLAGDQLIVDLDLSAGNTPPGTQLAIGPVILEVSAEPHTGCKKFVEHYGMAAMEFVNSPTGRDLNLRGVNARVVQPGLIRVGDRIRKL